MKPSLRERLIPYGIATAVAVLMAVGVYFTRGLTAESTTADRYRALSDSFAAPGMLFIMFGLLLWVAGEGALLGVTWLVKNAVFLLIPGKALDRVTYAEYREQHREKKTGPHAYIFVVGGVFCLISVVFVLLFNSVEP